MRWRARAGACSRRPDALLRSAHLTKSRSGSPRPWAAALSQRIPTRTADQASRLCRPVFDAHVDEGEDAAGHLTAPIRISPAAEPGTDACNSDRRVDLGRVIRGTAPSVVRGTRRPGIRRNASRVRSPRAAAFRAPVAQAGSLPDRSWANPEGRFYVKQRQIGTIGESLDPLAPSRPDTRLPVEHEAEGRSVALAPIKRKRRSPLRRRLVR